MRTQAEEIGAQPGKETAMEILKAMAVAFSTYSRIPMPQFEWKEKNMRYSMCFFPLIGAVIGALLILLNFGMKMLKIGSGLRSAVDTVLPLAVTGGIHLDGFMDTSDALSSYRDREERLRILKDPHSGAFAVIRAAMVLLLTYGLYTEADSRLLQVYGFAFVIARCLSGIAVFTFPKAKKNGMVHTISGAAGSAERRVLWILRVELIASACGMILTGIWLAGTGRPQTAAILSGLCPVLAGLAAAGILYRYYLHMAETKFGGTTGDLAGWFLTLCECFMLLGLVLTDRILKSILL